MIWTVSAADNARDPAARNRRSAYAAIGGTSWLASLSVLAGDGCLRRAPRPVGAAGQVIAAFGPLGDRCRGHLSRHKAWLLCRMPIATTTPIALHITAVRTP